MHCISAGQKSGSTFGTDCDQMKEIVAKFYNAYGGAARPQTFFEEAELEKTDGVRRALVY